MTALLRLPVVSFLVTQFLCSSVESATDDNFTFVNVSGGQCMLYAKRISLAVINDTQKVDRTGSSVTYDMPLENIIAHPQTMKCSDHSGKISLTLKGGTAGPYNFKLDSLELEFTFKSSQALQWWSVDRVEIEAKGSVMPGGSLEAVFNGSQLQQFIEGPKYFAYACGQQKPLVFHGPPETISVEGKPQEVVKVKYALKITNLEVQPFIVNRSIANHWYGFTNEVYDCVPFMSIGVWMFLFCTSILLCIVLSGIGMLASLKTNDRYDDIKGKPLVVNVKD